MIIMRDFRRLKFSFISFLIPALYRLTLELICEFPLGYDTNTSYIYHMIEIFSLQRDILSFFNSAPLYYYILYFLSGIIGIIPSIKVLAIILSGLFGYSIFEFYLAQKALSEKDACEAALLTFFYFVVLRLTWDFHRNVLALILIFMSLRYMEKNKAISYLLGTLSSLANILSFPLLFSYSLPKIVDKDKNYLLLNIIAGSLWLIMIFLQFKTNLSNIFIMQPSYRVLIPFPVGLKLLEFLLWAFAPLIIPLLLSIKNIKDDKDILMKIKHNKEMFSLFLVPVFASFFTVFGYRLVIVAAIPLSYLVFVFSDRRRLYRAIVIVLAINYTISPVLDGLTIYPIPDLSLGIWGPPGMPQGPFYFRDMKAAKVLFSKAKTMLNKSTALVVNHQLISAAYTAGINLTAKNVIVKRQFTDFKIVIYNLLANYTIVLVVWFLCNSTFLWIDVLKALGIDVANTTCDVYGYVPKGYIIIARYDRMALYAYSNKTLMIRNNFIGNVTVTKRITATIRNASNCSCINLDFLNETL